MLAIRDVTTLRLKEVMLYMYANSDKFDIETERLIRSELINRWLNEKDKK